MTNVRETNLHAGLLADTAAAMLTEEGIQDGVVVITSKYDVDDPLSIRTSGGDGFGTDKNNGEQQKNLLALAHQQAIYAKRTPRSASEQLTKLHATGRNAASYDPTLDPDLEPGYAHDTSANLTVVVAADALPALEAAKLSERAIAAVEMGLIHKISPAAEFIYACLTNLEMYLPENRSGYCLITYPIVKKGYPHPLVVISQATGALDPGNYGVVAAKARAVTVTGRASQEKTVNQTVSHIEGAIPITVAGHGQRVLAAGGLTEGRADVDVLRQTIDSLQNTMGISILNELAR